MTEAEKIAQAVAEGYPDVEEVCSAEGCGVVFKNYHHFIRCDRTPCPLSDGKTLFDRWRPAMTVKEWKESLDRSTGCGHCGCKLVELTEDGPICPRCERPREDCVMPS